jgi:hypothetical protein
MSPLHARAAREEARSLSLARDTDGYPSHPKPPGKQRPLPQGVARVGTRMRLWLP